jgi:hypothetical protein
MNPRDDRAAPVPQDLDSAYRALPPAAPAAALDAQVRAAVSAELAASPGHRRGVFAGLRQRMPLVSLATAATVLVAVGVGYLALPHHPGAEALRPVLSAPVTPLNPPPVRLQAPVSIDVPLASFTAPAAAPEAPPAVTPAAAPAVVAATASPPPPAKEEARVAGYTARSADSLAEVVVTESGKSASAPVTLDAVRALLHDGKRRAARKLLQRWQLQNRDASVPEDLQVLLDKAPYR